MQVVQDYRNPVQGLRNRTLLQKLRRKVARRNTHKSSSFRRLFCLPNRLLTAVACLRVYNHFADMPCKQATVCRKHRFGQSDCLLAQLVAVFRKQTQASRDGFGTVQTKAFRHARQFKRFAYIGDIGAVWLFVQTYCGRTAYRSFPLGCRDCCRTQTRRAKRSS